MEKDSLFPLLADLRGHDPEGGECIGRKGLCSSVAASRDEARLAQNRGICRVLETPRDFTRASCLGFPPDMEMGMNKQALWLIFNPDDDGVSNTFLTFSLPENDHLRCSLCAVCP